MNSDEQCLSNLWNLLSSSRVSFTCHLSSPVPTRHHSSLKKSFAWPEISSMIFLGIFWKSDGRWRLCFTFDKCALQPEESLPLSKDRPFQQKRNVILSLIFRPGKFLLDHTSILSSRLMYSQMREDWRGLSFNRAEWPIACQSEILL